MKARLPIALAVASGALALAAALTAGCGGLLIIQEPPDGGQPCCDGGLPDGGPTNNGPPDKTHTTLLVLPDTTVVADGNTTVTIRVTVRDSQNHLLPGVGVTMTCDGTANGFIPVSGAGYTGTDGTFQVALRSTIAEPKTVTVAVSTFTLTTGLTFIAGRPDPSTSTLVANPFPPTAVLADGVDSAAMTVTLKDQFSNIVTGYPVAFTSTGSNNTFTPAGAVSTDAQGVAKTRLSSTRAESKTVVATVGSLFVMTRPLVFIAGGASQAMSSLTANPTALPADGTTRTTLTVLARDANGNPVGNLPVTFSATGSANTFSPNPPDVTTSVDGVARVQLSSTVAETKTVTAQAAGVNLSTSVRFGQGTPTNGNSRMDVESPILADGTASGLITVTVKDGTGNPTQNVPVQLTASGSFNTFSPSATGNTNSLGEFKSRLSSPAAETKAVTATVNAGAFQLTNFMVFNPGPPVANSSQMSATPDHVPADGVSTTTITAWFRDTNGNPCPGLFVQLTSSGSSNTFSATTGTTDVDGAFSATLRSPKAELKVVSASAAGLTQQVLVSFDAGPPNAARSSVSATPNPMPVGFNTTLITATIKDALGNPVWNAPVSITATGSENYFDPFIPSGLTDGSGNFQVRLNSYVAEKKTITATTGALSLTTLVTFTPGDPYVYQSDFTVLPTTVRADGIAYATATLTARDDFGNLVPNTLVTFYSSNGTDHWSPSASGYTNASGVVTARLTSTVPEQKRITASAAGNFNISTNVTFVP
ncbi:MAG TPA: Ig-like domain-containing protein [Myxococcaceae bacterium]|nr:Ig-like domain-containing protein [Myxococcaceae bacterium]